MVSDTPSIVVPAAELQRVELGPLTMGCLKPGAAEAYKAACVRTGQREMQFKPAALQYRTSLTLAFDDYVMA